MEPVGGPGMTCDPASWASYWVNAAEAATAAGDLELGLDRLTEACRCYLQAADYFQLALRAARSDSAEHRAWSDAQISAFRAAMPLLPHPVTAFSLDVSGELFAGYLFRPDSSATTARPVVLYPVEGDAAVESIYLSTVVSILAQDMNVVTYAGTARVVGGPEPTPHWANGAVLAWVCRQPGVDSERVLVAPPSAGRRGGRRFDGGDGFGAAQ